jgi:hypothetical protein
MSKYDALGTYLRGQSEDEVPMTFAQIAKIAGVELPPSAKIRAWWSNNPTNSVLTKVWLQAGFRSAKVDMTKRKLVFTRIRDPHGVGEESKVFEKDKSDAPKGEIHPMIGALRGTFTVETGWDIAKPALDPEELEAWEARLDRMADEIQEKLSGK